MDYLDQFPEEFRDDIHAISTKTTDWAYEDEWRLAFEGQYGEGGDNKYGSSFGVRGCLREIYFGIHTDKPTIRCLHAAIKEVDETIIMKLAKPNQGSLGYVKA